MQPKPGMSQAPGPYRHECCLNVTSQGDVPTSSTNMGCEAKPQAEKSWSGEPNLPMHPNHEGFEAKLFDNDSIFFVQVVPLASW